MKFFTELLYDAEHGVLEFHFERIGFPSTTGYKVAVVTGKSDTYNFMMKPEDSKWKITEAVQLPNWIAVLEDELSDSILAHKIIMADVY